MRIVAHLDLDAFFAAVEERDNPRFKGLPIVIGADPHSQAGKGRGRGVVSTANYDARKYGIRSAMPISRAWQLSERAKSEGKPEAIFLPPDFKKYSKASKEVIEIIYKFSHTVEQASIDEAYFDLTEAGSYTGAANIAKKIKEEIRKKIKITASVGIGPNKLVAKIASDEQKPNGLTVVTENQAEDFLEPMKVRALPGIGPKTEAVLREKGILTIRDLKKISHKKLIDLFGKWGSDIYDKARGIDSAPFILEWVAKSIGEQETFAEDTTKFSVVLESLNALCESVMHRFKEGKFESFKTITLTVRFSDFETKNRSHTLLQPASNLKILKNESLRLLLPFFDKRENPGRKAIRLVGIRIENLS